LAQHVALAKMKKFLSAGDLSAFVVFFFVKTVSFPLGVSLNGGTLKTPQNDHFW